MADELLNEFVNEAREHLANIEADLLTIEEGGADVDEELVNKVFRAAHSIKGAAGFFGLVKVKELSHRAETVLDMLRSGTMVPNAEITNVLLAAFDTLREMITHADDSESVDISDLVVSLTGLASSYLPQEKKASLHATVALQADENTRAPQVLIPQVDFERAKRAKRFVFQVDYDLIHDIERKGKHVLQVFRDLETTGEILDCALDFDAAGSLDDDAVGNRLPMRLIFSTVLEPDFFGSVVEMPDDRITLLFDPRKAPSEPVPAVVAPRQPDAVAAPEPPPPPPPTPTPTPAPPTPPPAAPAARKTAGPSGPAAAGGAEETLRVNVGLLESLMNLVGELVLSRNQLRTAISQQNVQALGQADQRLNTVTSELQDAVMRTRLQPIGNVFNKFPRVVRDTAATLGKDIELDIRGKDVALDRSLIEGLSDPLTHMLRNAVDHGVEMPDERVRAGKRRTGTIRIDARHEAGQVVVEIADDGKGIDPKRIAESAVSKGLIPADKAAGLSDSDKVALIFLPGLSTSTKVSDISGRGVGMDVVKTNLDRLGGKVEIASEVGKGTTFRIKLPLTLAIIPSLILSVEGEQFAIPQINVEELLRIRAEEVKRRIEVVGGAEVLLLRDRIIPLVRLDRMLGVTATCEDRSTGQKEVDRRAHIADRRSPHYAQQSTEIDRAAGGSGAPRTDGRRHAPSSALEIAVVTTGTLQYGLVVGGFHSTEEIVVKPLGRHLKALREYAGATILGDGRIALILDVGGVAAKADLAAVSGSARALQQTADAERERLEDLKALLLFHNAPDEVCAVPLDSVIRLERVSAAQIETTGSRRTMQYRGVSLPLVTLADAASVMPLNDAREVAVIVGKVHGREVGLVGTMPVDVVETKAAIDLQTHRQPGIAGSAILNGKTTLIVDLIELVDMVHPDWRATRAAVADQPLAAPVPETSAGAQVVLLAEDSDFFRNQVSRVLQDEGYEVLAAPDGEAAWELLLANVDRITLVVTDIEMPRLTGLGLAQRIRSHPPSAHLPIIALTSLAGEDDVARGRAAGIDDYQVKLDRDRLVESLHATAALPSRTASPTDVSDQR